MVARVDGQKERVFQIVDWDSHPESHWLRCLGLGKKALWLSYCRESYSGQMLIK